MAGTGGVLECEEGRCPVWALAARGVGVRLFMAEDDIGKVVPEEG